jgi:hypothetical protein
VQSSRTAIRRNAWRRACLAGAQAMVTLYARLPVFAELSVAVTAKLEVAAVPSAGEHAGRAVEHKTRGQPAQAHRIAVPADPPLAVPLLVTVSVAVPPSLTLALLIEKMGSVKPPVTVTLVRLPAGSRV